MQPIDYFIFVTGNFIPLDDFQKRCSSHAISFEKPHGNDMNESDPDISFENEFGGDFDTPYMTADEGDLTPDQNTTSPSIEGINCAFLILTLTLFV